MIIRPTKEQFLERLKYEIEDMLRIKYNESFKAKDTPEEREYDIRGTMTYNTIHPWVRQESMIQGMCFWFGYEIIDVSKYHVQIKRGNKVIIDVNLEVSND